MAMDAAEKTDLVRDVIKECVRAEVRQLVHETLGVVLTELLEELRGGRTDASDKRSEVDEVEHAHNVKFESYVADPATPICEGYVCGPTYTSLSASEVPLDLEGVVLVDDDSIHVHMAMCQLTDTIVVTSATEVPSVCARSKVLDVVYFHKEHMYKATKLSKKSAWSSALERMRAYLGRKNAAFLQAVLQPDSGSVAVADIHEFLCRLPSDARISLFLELIPLKQGPRFQDVRDVDSSPRKVVDEVSILAHHSVPVVDGTVQGYRLRHTLGGANTMMEQTMPADFESSKFARIDAVVAEWVYGKEMIESSKGEKKISHCFRSTPIHDVKV